MSNLLPFPSLAPEPARSSHAAPPDAAVRAQALDIRRSFIVEAPAGSGKTALLIQRLLKLLADDSVTQPEQVLAITFTNAATAELRDRVLAHLESAYLESSLVNSTTPEPIPLAFAASTSPTQQPNLFDEQPDQQPDAQSDDANDFAAQTRTLALAALARDAALGWQLLDHPSRLNIRTIDSVCAEIANTLPVLSGSGGRLAATENAAPLHREAARRTLLHLGSGDAAFDAALRNLLLHRDGNLADCESLLAGMLALRDQWGDLIPLTQSALDDTFLDASVLPRLERALDRIVCASLSRLQQIFPADLLHDLAAIAADLGHLPSTTTEPSPIACCAGTSDPPEAVATHLDRWLALIHLLLTKEDWRKERGLTRKNLDFEYDRKHPHHPRLASIVDQLRHRDDLLVALAEVRTLPPARYPANQWAVAKSLFRILARALVELQFVFAERGECDFTELSLLARLALSADSGADDLANALGARLQHLLVDEMQDTSTGQYDLLELLTASWDGYSQTVFLVGDPHQSIYLFRQARVERFIQTLRTGRLGELPLTRLALTANFRSQRALVASFNQDFPLIFPHAEDDSLSLPYIPADATLPASPASLGQVWHANPQPPRAVSNSLPDLTPTQSQLDARTIARIASDWLARPLPPDRGTIRDEAGREVPEPWRIAVLVRARNHLAEVVPALRRAQLPFRAVDIETLHDRQEVLDLTALTRALLHPADRVAALAVLRAPWCGLSLADLHALTGADDSNLRDRSILRIIEDRARLLPADSQLRLSRIHSVLRSAATARARLTAAQLVERAWRSLGGDAPLTPPELTNARRFFELLDSLESSNGHVDPTQLEDRLTQLFAEPSPHPANTAFVELLTIHKAKGLEWDLVFLPALERQPAANTPRLLAWSTLDPLPSPDSSPSVDNADAPAHIMLAPIAARGEDIDALTRWLNRLHRARQYAENKRLFYVASTRARQELHLFAAPQLTAYGTLNPHPASLLSAAWPAASPHFAAALAAASTTPPQPASPSITSASHTLVDDDSAFGSADDALEIAASVSHPDENSGNIISFHVNDLNQNTQVLNDVLVAPLYPTLTRLPLDFDPATRFAEARTQTLPYGDASSATELDPTQFSRPEGSLDARAFGNAIHACIELLTSRIASGATSAALLAELPAWSPRISALLRAGGLPAATVSRLVRDAHSALENLLRDPDGQWLLAPHPGAATELSLTAAADPELATASPVPTRPVSVRPVSMRLDRIFSAGPEPHSPGSSHLWIVDYKTASHSASDPTALAVFLEAQRAAYAPQLEAYARALALAYSLSLENIRLALCLPVLPTPPRLIWWPAAAI